MDSYRPGYGNIYTFHAPPPPPPLPIISPLLPEPPPSYDPCRGRDSYRPPQSDFSYRSNDSMFQFPRDRDYAGPKKSRAYEQGRSRQRNGHSDKKSLDTARRNHNNRPWQKYRPNPADRPLLRHLDERVTAEQLLGITHGQKFMRAEDISDSDEEHMDESDSEKSPEDSKTTRPVAFPVGDKRNHAADESSEPPSKRRAMTSNSSGARNGMREPKWSNPDPYTVLPPIDEAARKKKDVVKLIRKARKDTEEMSDKYNPVVANEDFISFGIDKDDLQTALPNSITDNEVPNGLSVLGAPMGPGEFSHLHHLYDQPHPQVAWSANHPISAKSPGLLPRVAQIIPRRSGEFVLDLGHFGQQITSSYSGDENLGSRKRTHDDSIKGQMRCSTHNNGSILHEWRPIAGADPVPWLRRIDTITVNAGYRLHKEICDFYEFVKPKHFEDTIRRELLSRFQIAVSNYLPHSHVLCFGSFAAGIYLPNADMDVVVISKTFQSTRQKVVCQNKPQLLRFAAFLEHSQIVGAKCEVVHQAKVPIIKFVDRLTGIKVDVSFENETGIVANETFKGWKTKYPAMPVLVTVIKQFLMMRGLNEVQYGGLGGFSTTCLVTSLLQNMPRVQSGIVVPEQHLGEMLLEFLDLYGNHLDTTRTGISMQPPGYFEKKHSKQHRDLYHTKKADRLAIRDPNSDMNDISGGSRDVMLIFSRFAKAREEILLAMKSPGRISLLDWVLGGNYDSFALQRSHLLSLYQQKWGAATGSPAQDQFPDLIQLHKDPLNGLRGEGDIQSREMSLMPPESAAPIQGTVPMSEDAKRASIQKVKYPKMQSDPDRARLNKAQKIVGAHSAKPPQSSGAQRAKTLREKCPDMEGIPEEISKMDYKQLIAAYQEQNYISENGVAAKAINSIELKQRASHKKVRRAAKQFAKENIPIQLHQSPKSAKEQSNYPLRSHAATARGLATRSSPKTRPASNKMAPLSDARRAEVARNLSGASNNDPIALD